MNLALAAAMGIAGLAGGYFLPFLAHRLAERKTVRKGAPLAQDRRYTGLPVRAGAAAFTAAGWAAAGLLAGNAVSALLLALLWAETFLFAVIDLRVHLIPNELVLVMAVLGAAFQFVAFGPRGLLYAAAAMAAVMAVFLLLTAFLGFGAVGAGDVKLAGAMGLALGYPFTLTALVGMGAAMGLFSLYGFAAKKLTLRSMLPFAPFMMFGMVLALIRMVVKI